MGVHTFPKAICPILKVIARLEYELANYDSAVHRFNHEDTPKKNDALGKRLRFDHTDKWCINKLKPVLENSLRFK